MRSKNLIACMLLLLFSITVWAQESAVITGVVTDENKEPLIGVNIAIQNMPGLGVITDRSFGLLPEDSHIHCNVEVRYEHKEQKKRHPQKSRNSL